MGDVRLAFATYLDVIEEEAARCADALSDWARPLPSCPGWTERELAAHLLESLTDWRVAVEADDASEMHEAPTHAGDSGLVEGALEHAAAELVGSLANSGESAPVWNFSGAELTAGWIARRAALELALRRVDLELASGAAKPVERELAVDGVDERLEVHLDHAFANGPQAGLGGTLCLVANDDDTAWLIEVSRGRLRWRHGRGPADAALVGSASELFMFAWNRVGAEVLELSGSLEVARAWSDLPA